MEVLELTKQNFEQEALQAKETVLIDFWAPWCGPCRALSPIVDEIAQEGRPGLKVCKVNVDDHPELGQKYGVLSIPTLLVLRDGQAVTSAVGAWPKKKILEMLEKA